MRYSPYEHEYTAVDTMTENEILEYFLTRVFETEEVWGLDDGTEWIIQEDSGQAIMPVWPYQKFAADAAVNGLGHCHPEAESLEEFLHSTVPMLSEENTLLGIMPGRSGTVCLINPLRLKSILDGMIDAGEYTLDG